MFKNDGNTDPELFFNRHVFINDNDIIFIDYAMTPGKYTGCKDHIVIIITEKSTQFFKKSFGFHRFTEVFLRRSRAESPRSL